jgi:hypothetical protein
MADPALAALSPDQRERLALLGFDLLVLRSGDTDAPAESAADPASPRIALAGVTPDESSGIVRGILAALGLRAAQVATDPRADVPVLALGEPAPAGSIRLPSPAGLRDARAKRAAWPLLRSLRRRLQDGAGAA